MSGKAALILVDIQNDFLPGGPLGVPEGDRIIPVVNELQPRFDLVVATQDWHPPDHVSFAANHPGRQPGEVIEVEGLQQHLWPVHCVQETEGAELAAGLDREPIAKVFQKGVDKQLDSYSGFFDNGHRRSTGLDDFLREQGVTDVTIAGLATDVCVKYTAVDARRLDWPTTVLRDACRGIDLEPGDVDRALEEMQSAGVVLS